MLLLIIIVECLSDVELVFEIEVLDVGEFAGDRVRYFVLRVVDDLKFFDEFWVEILEVFFGVVCLFFFDGVFVGVFGWVFL